MHPFLEGVIVDNAEPKIVRDATEPAFYYHGNKTPWILCSNEKQMAKKNCRHLAALVGKDRRLSEPNELYANGNMVFWFGMACGRSLAKNASKRKLRRINQFFIF